MARDLDPESNPVAFAGAELRRARLATGLSQDQLARKLGFDRTVITKAETGERPPSPDVAAAIDETFPHLDGLFSRLAALARKANGPYPDWFREWVDAEQAAASLRWWEPILVPGLLQTPDYARELFRAWQRTATEDKFDQLVSGRMDRQRILDQPEAPELWALIDEAVLHRLVGSPKVMHDQLVHLCDMMDYPNVTVQIVPADVGAHPGLLGAFIIASVESAPDTLYVENAVEGLTIEKPALVSMAALAFDRLRADSLPRGASRELITRVANGRWTT